jgi:hypothetical protein
MIRHHRIVAVALVSSVTDGAAAWCTTRKPCGTDETSYNLLPWTDVS